MSLFQRFKAFLYTTTQDAFLSILSSGPIPRHIAFVMDGNRRHARMHQKQIAEGHSDGFVALRRVLELCLKLGVQCVSVYAFAVENFKRTPGEVGALMQLAEDKLLELCQHGDLLDTYGVRLNVLGKTELLPPSVQAAVKKAEEMTCKNNRAILNICMPYSSRHEITTAVESVVKNALEFGYDPSDITEKDIDAQLMTSKVNSPPLEILVRTSGVKRLSDYMLWQSCENTQLHILSTYWPDFGLLDFVPVILHYQRKMWAQPKAQS